MVDKWIKQEDSNKKAFCLGAAGLEGYAIITTANAEILKIDGKSTVEELLIAGGLANLVRDDTVVTNPEGKTFDLKHVPSVDEAILITNVSEGA